MKRPSALDMLWPLEEGKEIPSLECLKENYVTPGPVG